MDNTALFNITYGLYVIQTTVDGKTNGCIINTCNQIASSPNRIAVSLINENYTTELIKKSKVFKISILDKSSTYDFIKLFGLNSGRNFDKYRYVCSSVDENGIRYTDSHACSVLTCKVTESIDLTSHTLFICEVIDAKKTSSFEPITYAYYQSYLKPKTTIDKDRKIVAWRCRICGHIYEGEKLPDEYVCPLCGHGASDFEPIYE